jgi:hypothetical protein
MRCFLQPNVQMTMGSKPRAYPFKLLFLALSSSAPILLRGTVFKCLRDYLLLAPLASLPYHVTGVGTRFSGTSSLGLPTFAILAYPEPSNMSGLRIVELSMNEFSFTLGIRLFVTLGLWLEL